MSCGRGEIDSELGIELSLSGVEWEWGPAHNWLSRDIHLLAVCLFHFFSLAEQVEKFFYLLDILGASARLAVPRYFGNFRQRQEQQMRLAKLKFYFSEKYTCSTLSCLNFSINWQTPLKPVFSVLDPSIWRYCGLARLPPENWSV